MGRVGFGRNGGEDGLGETKCAGVEARGGASLESMLPAELLIAAGDSAVAVSGGR